MFQGLRESKRIPIYTTIRQSAKYCVPRGLGETDWSTGLSRLDKLLEFCQTPRTSGEICEFVGVKLNGWTRKAYVYGLVESGKLKMLNPGKRTSCTQRYMNADADIPTASAEEVMAYCQMPRTRTEIAEHFGLSWYQIKVIAYELVEQGKLVGSTPGQTKNRWQRFLAVDSELPLDINESILQFCQVPRSRKEIAERLQLDSKYLKRYLAPLIESGKLKMTKPEMPTSIDQRFITAGFDALIISKNTERELTLTKQAIIDYCIKPRTRTEVGERFGLKRHNVHKYLNALVQSGKLKMTIPLSPAAKQQRFVQTDIEITELSEKTLLEFCKTPRSVGEITNHFGISNKCTMGKHLYPIMAKGKLRHTRPVGSKQQKFVTADD